MKQAWAAPGVSNAASIKLLTNSGAIAGGNGGVGLFESAAGGVGVSNAEFATLGSLLNQATGAIGGGAAGGFFSGARRPQPGCRTPGRSNRSRTKARSAAAAAAAHRRRRRR